MLDLKQVVSDTDKIRDMLVKRRQDIDLTPFEALNAQRKALQAEYDDLRSKQNQASKDIARLKSEKKDAAEVISRCRPSPNGQGGSSRADRCRTEAARFSDDHPEYSA
jgi:seryl-tRNA synthetase